MLIVATPGLADAYTAAPAARAQYAERLGARADALAAADPLLTPARWPRSCRRCRPPRATRAHADRLLRLAVAASQKAALSSRLELYPRGMAAARAVKLGGLAAWPQGTHGPANPATHCQSLSAGRPVPGRPALDDLLREAGIDWVWDGTGDEW